MKRRQFLKEASSVMPLAVTPIHYLFHELGRPEPSYPFGTINQPRTLNKQSSTEIFNSMMKVFNSTTEAGHLSVDVPLHW